jgi:hypothetical protein
MRNWAAHPKRSHTPRLWECGGKRPIFPCGSTKGPDAALRWLAQHSCPVVLPVLERYLQQPRFVDPFWGLRHGLAFHNRNTYGHFLTTLIGTCHTVWPQLAAAWPTLGYAAQSWLLQCWLCVSDPAQCQWDETTTKEQKQADLKAVLTRLYAKYKDEVLHACYHWHPGMVYPYKENPAYGLQPSGWGLAGQPLGLGKSTRLWTIRLRRGSATAPPSLLRAGWHRQQTWLLPSIRLHCWLRCRHRGQEMRRTSAVLRGIQRPSVDGTHRDSGCFVCGVLKAIYD